MTTFLLIRHALCDPVGVSIAGRAPGIHLNDAGRRQADALARRLGDGWLAALYSGPLERARETAAPIATASGMMVRPLEAVQEIDFGEWTGRTLAALEGAPGWRAFNANRGGTRIPGGETMLEVQARVIGGLETLRRRHPDGRVGVVTHGDVIRAALVHFLGMPIDLMLRLEIAPASVSAVAVDDWGPRVLGVNEEAI